MDVCRALRTLVDSNQAVASIEGEDNLALQGRVSQETAKANLEYLGGFAGNFLAVLFNVYGQTIAQSRGHILQTINSYLGVTPVPALVETFDRVCKLLGDALQEESRSKAKTQGARQPEEQLPSTSHTLLDLVITMSVHLPRESFSALFEIASLAIIRDDDPQLQKKAYKLIPRLAESPVGKAALAERHSELRALIAESAEKVSAPARRERLGAIGTLLPLVPDTALHFIRPCSRKW